MTDKPRTGRYNIPGALVPPENEPAPSHGRLPAVVPTSQHVVPHVYGYEPPADPMHTISQMRAEIDQLRGLVSTANTRITAIENERVRDSQASLEEELEKAKEILKERDERSRHWTRWAAQVVVSLIIGAILLLIGKFVTGGAHRGEYAPRHEPQHTRIAAMAAHRGHGDRLARASSQKRTGAGHRPEDPGEG